MRPRTTPLRLLPALARASVLAATCCLTAPAEASAADVPPAPLPLAGITPEQLDFGVLVDQPGDGPIWALGQTYKASFAEDGTTFFPILGPQAERHEPLRLQLESVRCAGESIAFDRDVPPRLAQDRRSVSFARGALVESYQLEGDSIEQLFRFETLPSPGALEIRVQTSGEHSKSTGASRLELRGERSVIGYSRAVAVDASGKRTPLATEWEGDDIVIRVDTETVAHAHFPLVIDPVVQSFQIQQSSLQDTFPDIALDMSTYNYLVVWERTITSTDRDVLAMFFDRTTLGISGFVPINIDTESWTQPRVASHRGAGTFFVASTQHVGNESIIAGRAVLPFSLTPGPIVQFGQGRSPDVGGTLVEDPNAYYLLAFERAGKIRAVRVSSTGTSGVASQIEFAPANCVGPVVSKSSGPEGTSQRWTIVAQQNGSPSRVLGFQLSDDFLITMFGEEIAPSSEARVNPSVSSILEQTGEPLFVVSHESFTTAGSEVALSLMRGETELDTRILVELDGSSTVDSRFNADVACDGENVVVSYQELSPGGAADIYTSSFRVENDQLVLIEGRELTAGTSNLEGVPAVLAARDGGGSHGRFSIVYSSFGNGEIYGAEYHVPAPNDTCSAATPIGLGSYRGTLVGATLDTLPACGFVNGDPTDVWYRFTSPVTGRVTISTCGTADLFGIVGGASTVLSLYDDRSCPVDPGSETCSADSAPVYCDIHGDDSILEFDTVAGSQYLLRVGTKFLPTREDFVLELDAVPANLGVTFCLCTHDSACGNTSTTAGCTNGSGVGAFLDASGTRSIGAADLLITCRDLPSNAPGILFGGTNQLSLPFFNGRRCASGPFYRFPVRAANGSGVATEPGPAGGIAARVGALPGQTTRLQWWYRDGAGPCGTGANYSSGFALTWVP